MRRSGGLPWRGGAAFAAAMLLGVTAADASARVCRQLEAELASAGSAGGAAKARKHDRMIAGQQAQLELARQRSRQAGCGFFGILSPRTCGGLNEQIDRMEENLAALERSQARAPGSEPRRSRSAILASLEANGCRDRAAVAEPAAAPQPEEPDEDAADLFAKLSGDAARDQQEQEISGGLTNIVRVIHPGGQTDVYGPSGEFATMCVRTCDGYFFPVSPSSSAADFHRDQKNCEATCPGTEVQLYYRPIGSDDSGGMKSTANGDLYMSLPAAYRYKDSSKRRVTACGCKGASIDPNFSIIGGEPQQAQPLPDPAADPYARADLAGGLDLQAIERILKPKPPVMVLPPPGERKVRVVGPVFLPDPGAAINLKAPARTNVQ
jgi:hypothetical protein